MHSSEQRVPAHQVEVPTQLFDAAEAAATLALRDGKTEAIGFYLDKQRVHVGDLSTITENVFTAWQRDSFRILPSFSMALCLPRWKLGNCMSTTNIACSTARPTISA